MGWPFVGSQMFPVVRICTNAGGLAISQRHEQVALIILMTEIAKRKKEIVFIP